MKRILFVLFLFIAQTSVVSFAKNIKVTVTPEDASIYVDNNFEGKGVVTVNVRRKEGHVRVKIEKEGYVTRRFKLKADEKRNAIDIELEKDEAWDASTSANLANKFFTIPVSEKYIASAGNKEEAQKLAWKQLHQILLKYIEEIEESNMLGGYIQSAWVVKKFYHSSLNDIDGGIQWRTRVTIKESSGGEGLEYRVRISSEVAPLNTDVEEYFQPTQRLLKSFEPMISEFQARLGSL